MGGIFKKTDPHALLVELMNARVPPAWKGANITVVPVQGGTRVLITNLDNDDQDIPVNHEIADVVMRIVGSVAGLRAAQIQLTRKGDAEWDLEFLREPA